jgi:hypothetical protein
MNPSLLPYTLLGAIGFALLSVSAAKYRGDNFEAKHLIRDSIAGAIFTAFLLVLIPDMFPQLTFLTVGSAAMAAAASSLTSKMSGGGSSDDYDIQVGYIRR